MIRTQGNIRDFPIAILTTPGGQNLASAVNQRLLDMVATHTEERHRGHSMATARESTGMESLQHTADASVGTRDQQRHRSAKDAECSRC